MCQHYENEVKLFRRRGPVPPDPDAQMLDCARAVAAYASGHGIGDSLAVVHLAEKYERLRDAATRALDICDDAADMTCTCDGYYRCLGCEQRIAQRADDAAEVLRDALAAAKSEERER